MALYRFAIRVAAYLAIFGGVWSPLLAQDLKTPEFLDATTKGFDCLFSLDHEDARTAFQNLRQQNPKHPGPPFYLAVTQWQHELFRRQDLRLDQFVAPGSFLQTTAQPMSAEDRNAFFRYIAESQAYAQAILKEKPANRDARYFLGATHALLGAFALTIDQDKREAFRQGKQAYEYHLKIVQEQPDYADAYATVGLYEYIVDNLPWYMKWVAQIAGYTGSEERGFQYLRSAAARSRTSDHARTVLVVLCVREKLYSEALEHAQFLQSRFPRNFLLHLNVARILTEMNRPDQAAEVYAKIIAEAEARTPNYNKVPLGVFRYSIGKALMKLGRLEPAQRLFSAAIADPATAQRERALSHLCLAQALDLNGSRQQAIANYQQVLHAANYERSHRTAQAYLRKPYRQGKMSCDG